MLFLQLQPVQGSSTARPRDHPLRSRSSIPSLLPCYFCSFSPSKARPPPVHRIIPFDLAPPSLTSSHAISAAPARPRLVHRPSTGSSPSISSRNLLNENPSISEMLLGKQGEPENPKHKPDTRKPIFNVRWMLRVHFVIWVTISTWEPKRTSNGTATSLPPSPVSDCHAYNSSAFFSCQTDTTHQKTGKTLKSGVASFLPKKWDSTFTSVLVLASQQFKHLKCS